MANIKDKIDNIKTAVFGKDVRGALAEALDLVNKETEITTGNQQHLEDTFEQLIINAGTSNAEVVDARVDKKSGEIFAKVGDRLDKTSGKLADIIISSDNKPTSSLNTIWFETNICSSQIGNSGLIIKNAIISNEEIEDKEKLWFDV